MHISDSKIGLKADKSVQGKRIWEKEIAPEYAEATGSWLLTDFCYWRTHPTLYVTKLVVVGYLALSGRSDEVEF